VSSGTGARAALSVGAALVALTAMGGVAVAVSAAARDTVAVLPDLCRDALGSAGGALPSGSALEDAFGRSGNGSTGVADPRAPASGLGAGSDQQRAGRLRARQGGGADTRGSSAPSAGSAGAPRAPAARGGEPGGGNGAGGPGGSGQGSGSGPVAGPGGGSGTAPVPGSGPDASGEVQPFTPPVRSPPAVPPPVAAPSAPAAALTSELVTALVVAAVLLAVGLLVARLLRRARGAVRGLLDATGLHPAEAAGRAAAATADGDHDAALRWTFVTGLLRLDEAAVLAYDPARTTRECARRLHSARFRELGRGFDVVAYGGRHADPDDVTAARAGWAALLREIAPAAERASV